MRFEPQVVFVRISEDEEYIVEADVTVTHSDTPHYDGEYIVTPKAFQEQVLETADKLMDDNVRVLEIPYYETGNVHGGNTVYIGGNING